MIYDFIWSEICDWYIEIAKPRLYGKETPEARATAQHVLVTVLTGALKLLHPYMPFITEEIYQALPHDCESIMISAWPKAEEKLIDKDAETAMNAIMEAIKSIRNMRAEVNADPHKKVKAILLVAPELMRLLRPTPTYIELSGRGGRLTISCRPAVDKPQNAMAAVNTGVEVYLPLSGLIDVELETQRLNKELAGLEKDLQRSSGKLKNKGFLAKAPAAVVAKEQEKLTEFTTKMKAIKERLAYLQTIK
jgi:valyl-tRNA synthetase